MKYIAILLLFQYAILLGQPTGTTQIPKWEVRAVWLTTTAGLDWPKSTNVDEQKRSLLNILTKLKFANFNTIFFQVRSRGDAFYKSNYEPWSHRLTGQLGKDPGWDPLLFVLEYAKSNCLEVHAWFNTFRVADDEKKSVGEKNHIMEKHPNWIKKYNQEVWLDPGIPEVREYNLKVALDLIRNYNIDGIHFDFIRYPGSNFPDHDTYNKYGNKENKDHWRRENINKFVRAIYDSAICVKPMLKVGSAPIGVYKSLKNAIGWQSYSEIYQDSRTWLKEKKHDYLAPQVYWSLGTRVGDPDFAAITKDWSENNFGRHIYIGVGVYKPEVFHQLPLIIDVTRLYGNQGNSYFRYEHLKENLNLGNRYMYPAIIPPMKWKDSIPPNPPINLKVNILDDRRIKLEWLPPKPAGDNDTAKQYILYRSSIKPVDVNNPANILTIISASQTSFIDMTDLSTQNYHYAVTSLDKGNNESLPASEIDVSTEPVLNIDDLTPQFLLSYLFKPCKKILYIVYEVEHKSHTLLRIEDYDKSDPITLVDEIKDAGRYIVGVETSKIKKGSKRLILECGRFSYSHTLKVD